MNVIQTSQLCKSYGDHRVLYDVDLAVAQGSLVGFLGPNGAGKTTTIRILMGLLRNDSGGAQIFGMGCDVHGKSIRRRVGYLSGDVHFYPGLTGLQTLRFLARARQDDCEREIERLSTTFELDLAKTVRKYSTGMRQKLGLIQALMHRPELLILDEPTSGLDPLVRKAVFAELQDVVLGGRTVMFSSHSLDEVEELCDQVIILRDGRIVEHQSIVELKRRALKRVEVVFQGSLPTEYPPQFQLIRHEGQALLGTWSGKIAGLLQWVMPFELDDLIIERPDLNDLFITYYADPVDERAKDSS